MDSTWVLTFQEALDYLHAALPETDLAMHGETMPETIARRALRLFNETPWAASIPRDVFLPYVLFPRVNNEHLEDNGFIADQVCPLTRGLTMQEAALKVNLWCFEQATYRSTDIRTSSPSAIIRAGFGRCGEESTLAVCALRAACIPARQVYVPRWAHCDDNHAWVEVWIDGAWHYMGACEPEPQLDTGWFTAAASKAMMVHTRCYGLVPETERVEKKEEHSCIINRTAAYAPTCLLNVHVRKDGMPLQGALVRFLLCNEAEFSPICEKETDEKGTAQLLTGFGGLIIEALHQGRRLYKTIDLHDCNELTLDMEEAAPLPAAPLRFSLVPPTETRMQTVFPSPDARMQHSAAMQQAEQRRLARLRMPEHESPFIRHAAGNADAIRAFLEDERFTTEDQNALLSSLSEKDLFDATADMLADALMAALPHKASFPNNLWTACILCPRIAFEKRLPIRKGLLLFPGVSALHSPDGVWQYAEKHITVRPSVPDSLYPDSLTALQHGFSTAMGRRVLFVDLCRALGMPARLNPVTDEPEYWVHGAFVSAASHTQKAQLTLRNESGVALPYGERLTIAKLDGESAQTLALRGTVLNAAHTFDLQPGQYLITCATRQIDGTVDGVSIPLALHEGEEKTLTVAPPEDTSAKRLLRIALPPLAAIEQDGTAINLSLGDFSGTGGILSFIAPGEEPTEHFLLELREKEKQIISSHIRITLAVENPKALAHERLRHLPFVRFIVSDDAEGLVAWRRLLHCGDARKPLSIAVGRQGTALFAYANYHVGSVDTLLRMLDIDRQSLE